MSREQNFFFFFVLVVFALVLCIGKYSIQVSVLYHCIPSLYQWGFQLLYSFCQHVLFLLKLYIFFKLLAVYFNIFMAFKTQL